MLQTLEGNREQEKAGQVKIDSIAVCGSHPATVAKAPFDKPNWLMYVCSPHNIEHRTLPRVSAWFEIHLPIQDRSRSYHYLRALEDLDCPVYMRVRGIPEGLNPQQLAECKEQQRLDILNVKRFRNAVIYPEKEMKEKFGPFCFTSTIAFMMAKAIVDCEKNGYKNIGLFGIMQASPGEYQYQRPGIQALIWEATKRGINVYAPEESGLFEPPAEAF